MKNYSFIIADTNFKVQFNTYTSSFSISKNNFFPHSKRKTYQCFSMKISIWGSCYSIFSFICMFCRSLFVLLYYFLWLLCCQFFFDIRILITSLCYIQTLLTAHMFYFYSPISTISRLFTKNVVVSAALASTGNQALQNRLSKIIFLTQKLLYV